jgi:hypothetical protein
LEKEKNLVTLKIEKSTMSMEKKIPIGCEVTS